MSHPIRKLFIALIFIIAIGTILLITQFKKSLNIIVRGNPTPLISDQTIDIQTDKSDATLGNPGAALQIVEFLDLGDKQSKTTHKILVDFVSSHPKDAELILKQFPSQGLISGDSNPAHIAAYCANQQKKIWPFLDELISNGNLKNTTIQQVATNLSFNMVSWTQCLNSSVSEQKVADDVSLAHSLGINSGPALFINNKKINLKANPDLAQMLKQFIEK
jgi:protein-disulfide isomerase